MYLSLPYPNETSHITDIMSSLSDNHFDICCFYRVLSYKELRQSFPEDRDTFKTLEDFSRKPVKAILFVESF